MLVDEPKALTTRAGRARRVPRQAARPRAKFVAAHHELTDWIERNPAEAQQLVRDELKAETHSDMAPDLVAKAWERIVTERTT